MSKKFFNSFKYPSPIPIGVFTPYLNVPPSKSVTLLDQWKKIVAWVSHILKSLVSLILPRVAVPVHYTNGVFKVTTVEHMKAIWSQGFYGKGILSRSEPTWLERQGESDSLFSEQITQSRRVNRDLWKKHRDSLVELENSLKRQSTKGELTPSQQELLVKERQRLSDIKDQIHKLPDLNGSASIDDLTSLDGVEYLQLAPYECLFLLQTGCVSLSGHTPQSLFTHLVDSIGLQFVIDYAVYYHYRSLGWCVKPGLKFSVDFVCYSRGPPFTHAEFALKVLRDGDGGTIGSNGEIISLIDLSAIMRVSNGVKKTLILVSVVNSSDEKIRDNYEEFLLDGDLIKLLNCFFIGEFSLNRWAPSRTRQ